MPNNYFNFKQFTIHQDKSSFKVGTDGVLLGACADISNVGSILEIGTGTGLVSIMLAQRCTAMITTIEPDYESYLQASANVKKCNWNERIKVENTDFQSFTQSAEKFDLIITNPPYFSDSLKSPNLRKTAARHNDSLSSEEIIDGTIRLLKDSGSLQLIMPYIEGNIFIAEAARHGLFCNSILKIRPLPTSEIRRLILIFSKTHKNPEERFLTIEHGRHHFTDEYINLTKDFYMKF
jgi:tRNA1Val (adenine37-N6)-methyltransferase